MCRDRGYEKSFSAATTMREGNRKTTPNEVVSHDFHEPQIPYARCRVHRHNPPNPLE